MLTHNLEQRSEAWNQIRAGIPTASEFDKLRRVYGKNGKQTSENIEKIRKYATKKVAELLIQRPIQKELYTRSIEIGTIREADAVMMYEMIRGVKTSVVGFVTDDNRRYGCSPDRFVGTDGIWEGKAPDEDTHVGYMLDPDLLYANYMAQVQGQLFVCDDRQWVDLFSYHPEMKPVVIRIERDPEYQANLKEDLESFRDVMNDMILDLCAKGFMKL